MPHGKLRVVVESATGIKDPTSYGRGDSYCTLQCGSQALSTHVAEGGSSYPVYHTEFEFEIDRSTNDLAISVYSRDSVNGKDELVGYTALDFKEVFYHGHTVPLTAYPLTRSSGKPGGSINISLTFKARPSPYANPHAPVRQHSAPQYHVRNNDFDDGYGSSGSDSSRGSFGRRSSTGSAHVRRTQSQPAEHQYDHQDQFYAPAAAPARRPIPGGPQPPRVAPHQAQPVYNQGAQQPVYHQAPQQPVYYQAPQQPVHNQGAQQPVYNYQAAPQQPVHNQGAQQPVYNYQAAPQQPVYNRVQAQPRPVQQQQMPQRQQRQQQQVVMPQQQQQGPSVAAQVGTAVAASAARATVQGLFGLLGSEL